jgi:hypothetical protein
VVALAASCLSLGMLNASASAAEIEDAGVVATRPTALVLVDRTGRREEIDRFVVEGDSVRIWPVRRASTAAFAVGADRRIDVEPKTIPRADCVAIFRDVPLAGATSGVLVFTDGQRFPGNIVPRESADGTILAWRHPWIGAIDIVLERTRGIVVAPGAVLPESTTGDVVLLGNGDRVEGLVERLAPQVRIERIGTDAAAPPDIASIPIDRISAIALVTPRVESTQPRIWIVDGTVLDGEPVVPVDRPTGVQVLRAKDGPLPGRFDITAVPWADERRRRTESFESIAAFAPSPSKLLPLAAIEARSVESSGDTPRIAVDGPVASTAPHALDCPPILVRGPVVVRWDLPESGCLLVGELHVAEADPRWTHFDVVLRDGDRELLRRTMEADSRAVPIAFRLEGRSLSIEVTEGDGGPIRDALLLRRMLVVRP